MYKKYKKHIKNKLNKIYKNGFTLIELLVVISIISILSNIVINGFSESRAKAYNASIQSTLSSLRSKAVDEYISQSPYSFSGICGGGPVDLILDKLGKNTGLVDPDYQCVSTQEEWVAIFPLRMSNKYYCTDSLGNSKIVDGFLDSGLDGDLNCNHATLLVESKGGEEDEDVEKDDIPIEDGSKDVTLRLSLYGDNPYITLSLFPNPFDTEKIKLSIEKNPSITDKINEISNKLLGRQVPIYYEESGYEAIDNEYGDLTKNVKVSGPTLLSAEELEKYYKDQIEQGNLSAEELEKYHENMQTAKENGCVVYNYQFLYQIGNPDKEFNSTKRFVYHYNCGGLRDKVSELK
jgi:prepilin-type N-terminal cleavage/methylation domain-containing protein